MTEMQCAGDINGDGYGDVYIATADRFLTRGEDGFVYWGGPDGMVGAPFVRFPRPLRSPTAAWPPSGTAGDINGDGRPDLQIVSGERYDLITDLPGIAFGSPSFSAEFTNMALPDAGLFDGQTVSRVSWNPSDFNGDGYADVVLLSKCPRFAGAGCDAGIQFRRMGSSSASAFQLIRMSGFLPTENLSATAEDLDGDGFSDLIVDEMNHASSVSVAWGSRDGLSVTFAELRIR